MPKIGTVKQASTVPAIESVTRNAEERLLGKVPEFYINHAGRRFDLLPAAHDALVLAGKQATLDAEALARYTMKYGTGDYIRVKDIPDGMSRDLLENLISRVLLWALAPHRLEQLQNPDLRQTWSHVELCVDKDVHCSAALELAGKVIDFKDAPKIPLESCRLGPCFCRLRSVRRNTRTE